MAFASVISLKNIIERLLYSSKLSLLRPSQKIIEFAYKKLESLQEILKKLDSSSKRMSRTRVNALDVKIRQVVSNFEDLLEFHLSDQICSPHSESKISINLQHLTQDVNSFIETAEKMEAEYVNELENLVPEEEGESGAAEFGRSNSKMVGLSEIVDQMRKQFTRAVIPASLLVSIVGMAGIGKTTIAKEIFYDPLVSSHFECCAWIKVGRICKLDEISRSILSQVDKDFKQVGYEDEGIVNEYLYEFLKDKRYLVVLDDVWETEVWEYLRCCFPESGTLESRILITTRVMEVPDSIRISFNSTVRTLRLLNDEESWHLFREKVFGEEYWCPPKLEEAGKKIVKICDGLPLTIIKVAELLSKADITVEYWNEVAKEREHPVFMDVYGEISKIISPSYDYLPQQLKPCFLYMGVFPKDYEFSRSKLIDMWIAEGFLVPIMGKTLEESGTKCLVELVSNSVVVVCEKSTILNREIQTCRLHSSFWHFSKMEVGRNKFFTVLNNRASAYEEGLRGQRRLSIHNNILLGIKDVYGAIEDECPSSARSLLCLGPYHQYPLPLCYGLRFLRVLRALSIRLYEFPMEVLELVQLRYLALTYNGNLPASISKLFNLQFLIIHRHLIIKSHPNSQSYVPIEIWDMQELMHLQIMGSDLPESTSLAFLKNLRTLLDVSAESCTKRVLRKISNLKKLGIRIELVPDDDCEPFRCLNNVSCLGKLESLKCIVVNPELMPEVVAPLAPLPMLPSTLIKLHLSGLCCPWEYMDIIGSLPKLEVLKLQAYAFQGPNWEIEQTKFPRLKYLVIEDSDLVRWKVGSGSFSRLRHLSIKHCYNLEVFEWEFYCYFKVLQVVDSNPLAEAFFNKIKDHRGRRFGNVSFDSSWELKS